MELLFVACAETATVDAATNRLSMFNIAEEVPAAMFPSIIQTLTLVILLARSKGEGDDIQLKISADINGQQLFELPFNFSFLGKPRARGLANLQGIPLPSAGTLTFHVSHKKKTIGSWPIVITALHPTAISPPPPPIMAANTTEPAPASVSSSQSSQASKPKRKARRKVKRMTSRRIKRTVKRVRKK